MFGCEARRGSRFTKKAFAQRDVRRELGGQNFERNGPVETNIARQVHGTHTAASQLALDDVSLTETRANLFDPVHQIVGCFRCQVVCV
jgi:hypothetical protein